MADGQPAAPLSQQIESLEDTDFYSKVDQTPSVTTGQHRSDGENRLVLIDKTEKSFEKSGSDQVAGVKSFTTDVKSAESQVTWESETTDSVGKDMQAFDEESKISFEESKKILDNEDQKTTHTEDQQPSASKETSSMTVTMSESETKVSLVDKSSSRLQESLHETSTDISEKPRNQKSETCSVSKHNTLSDSVNQVNQENMSGDAEQQSPDGNMLGNPDIMSKVHQSSHMQNSAAENVTPTDDSRSSEPSTSDEKDSSMHASQTQRDISMHASQTQRDNISMHTSQTQKLGGGACEGQISTGYLDGVISDMQSMSGSQCEAGDSVQISRAELALMVAQTLKAQTMSTYMQDLVHTNTVLNTQNEVMKETIVQMRNSQTAGDKGEKDYTSLPPLPTEAEVFRFDKYSLPPTSLPVVLDRPASTSGFCPFSKLDQASASQNTGQEHPMSLVQMDGESISVVPQLADCVSFDGDPSLHSKENRGASAAGSSGNAGASASNFAPNPGLPMYNMPDLALFDNARCYSLGPQQQMEILVGSAGVPPEQHQLATDELEKMKMFLHKICTEGGVHPNNLMELANLRNQVNHLRSENGQLKAELENRPVPPTVLNRQIQDLNQKILQQKKREDKLLQDITKLHSDNKKLRDPRPSSQPPSSVGLHALPTIPALQNPVASRESELQTDKLQKENDKLRQLCAEARRSEMEAKEAAQQAQSKLKAAHDDTLSLRHDLKGKITHCEELGNELRGLNTEIDRLKKMHLQEADRCKQLEQMIADERNRWSRDEKQLLDQVRKDAKFIQALEELVLAVDRVQNGVPLQPSQKKHLADLKEQNASRGPLTTSARSTKSASSRAGATTTSTSSSRTQHQIPRSSSGNTSTSAGPRPLQGFHGSSREGGGSSAGGRGTHSSAIQGSGSGSPASLPSVLPQQRTRQHSGTPAVQPHGNRPLQRSNIAGSSPEMLPPPGPGAGSGRQRQQ